MAFPKCTGNEMDRYWLKSYPPGVPHEIQPEQYRSLTHLLEESFAEVHAPKSPG